MTNKLLPARKYRVFFLLICGTGLYFFANLQRVAIPGTVFNHLQENLHAGAPYITALGASFMYVYAVSQLLVGLFLDRYGGNLHLVPFHIFHRYGERDLEELGRDQGQH